MLAEYRHAIITGTILASTIIPGTAYGQNAPETDTGGISEILVVAQRREQNIQDVPISITAISADDLRASGVTSTNDLSQSVAGLNITTQSGNFFPRIRGVGNSNIGPGLENGVAVYVDGVYVSSGAAGLMSLSNIERIEVLKGPQGTLFGRNSTGGLIQVITRKPEHTLGGQFRGSYDNFETVTLDGYVTSGLTEDMALDFAGHYSTQGQGWGKNIATGKDVYKTDTDLALRSSLLFTPSDATEIRLTMDYSKIEGSFFTRRPLPGTTPRLPAQTLTSVWDTSNDFEPVNNFEGWGVAGYLEQDLGFAQLTSISSYRDSSNLSKNDADFTNMPGLNLQLNQTSKQITQEIQLSSQPASDILWIVGGYYFHESAKFDPALISFFGALRPAPPFGIIALQTINTDLTTESFAGFAEVTVPMGDRTNITAGLRYTTEKRTIDALAVFTTATGAMVPSPPVNATIRASKPTWRIALDHELSPELMVYASYNRGFKSGGFNGATPSSPPFVPEVLDAFEAGFKSDLFDRQIRLNASSFYYTYKNIQLPSYPGGTTVIYNGAQARIYGLDVDFEARVTPQLTLSGGIEWINSEFTSFPLASYFSPAPGGGNTASIRDGSGNTLAEAPDFVGNITADYRIPASFGEVGLTLSYSYNDGYFAQPDNVFFQPSFNILNGSISFDLDAGFGVQLWAKNITNAKVTSNLASNNDVTAAGYRAPRTYGVSLMAEF